MIKLITSLESIFLSSFVWPLKIGLTVLLLTRQDGDGQAYLIKSLQRDACHSTCFIILQLGSSMHSTIVRIIEVKLFRHQVLFKNEYKEWLSLCLKHVVQTLSVYFGNCCK